MKIVARDGRSLAILLVWLTLWSSTLTGCTGTSTPSTSFGTSSATSSSAPNASVPTITLRGRLKLDVPVAGASVTAVDSATKAPLSLPAVTGRGGFFTIAVPTSGAFTLVATAALNGVSEIYGRCYDQVPASRFLHINAITTIAARYRERHPTMRAADAERAVKRALGMPQSLDAGTFGHAHSTARFAHTAFLRAARAYSGGEPAYVETVVAQVDAPTAKDKRVLASAGASLPDLSALFSTLQTRWQRLWSKQQQSGYNLTESDLQEVEESDSAFTDASSVVSNDLYNDGIESSSVVASSASADVAEDVASGVAAQSLRTLAVEGFVKGAAGAVGGICIQALFSAIFPSANPEAAVLQALQVISGQLTRIQSSITQLQAYVSSAFAQSEYYANAESLRGAFTIIDTAWNGPDNSGSGGYAGTLSQAAQGSPSGNSAAASALADILPGGQNYQSIATLSNAQSQIANAQIAATPGAPSLMQQFRDLVSPTVSGNSYRYVSNLTINQMYGQFTQLAAYQMKAAQVIACLQRAGTPTSAPDFDGARATIKATNDQIQQQRSMLPFPMTDDKMIYDTSSGLVLYGEVFAPTPVTNLDFTQRQGGWPNINRSPNSDPWFPWPNGNGLIAFSAGDLSTYNNYTLFLPTPGLLWTFLDPNQQTYSVLDAYSRQPGTSPAVSYLQVLEQYGLGIDSPQPWTFNANYLRCNGDPPGNFLYVEGQGTGNPAFSTVITTGYYSPWNEVSLLNASAWPFQDRFDIGSAAAHPQGAVFDPGNWGYFSVITADNSTVAPYVLMAYAAPRVQPSPLPAPGVHPDLGGSNPALPNTELLCDMARVAVVDASGNPNGGLHCATNRALFGCGSQQAAAVAFQGTQLVALGAENPMPGPQSQDLFGLTGVPTTSLLDLINQYYGYSPLSQYVEGPNGIDNDIDTCYGGGDTLINTCWDLTPYLYWSSSNPAVADVSNTPGQIGRIVRVGGAPAGTVTFTGTRVELNRTGAVGTPVTMTCQYTFPALPAAALQKIFITPRYQTLHVVAQPQQITLFAVGGYTDGTSQTLPGSSNGVTWSSSDPKVQVASDGTVVVTGTPTSQTVTITATSGSVSSTVDLTVLNP